MRHPPAPSTRHLRRFDQPWEAAASIALRAGDTRAVDAYAERGRLFTSHPALIASDVARLHQRDVGVGRTVAITTNTAEVARSINPEIQRLADPRNRRPRLRLADGTHVSVGDQIATRRNRRDLRTDQYERVRNRQTWTVIAIDSTGRLTASHPGRGSVTLPADYVGRHVELGWAVTGYGNQGDTVDVGVDVLESSTTRDHAYVALTRGRQVNLAWMPDPTGTLDPASQLAGMITRTPNTASGLATRDRLYREAGLSEPEIRPERNRAEPARPQVALARFWAATLEGFEIRGYDDAEIARLACVGRTPEDDPCVIVDGPGLEICFHSVDVRDVARKPLHADLATTDRAEETRRLMALGASIVEKFDTHTWMRDPEANDFCVTDA